MIDEEYRRKLLRMLPSVNCVLSGVAKKTSLSVVPRILLTSYVRSSLHKFRYKILKYEDPFIRDVSVLDHIVDDAYGMILNKISQNLKQVVNGTGIVIHTNLGRSPLPEKVIEKISLVSSRYSNLEFDLTRGLRGSRNDSVESLLCQISGSEAAFVVNNNAAAVLISLDTMARDKEVIISRGELVEIGGSFRLPDIMLKSGCLMKEVGTTNCTHLDDYVGAITNNTGLLLKVHTSNYGIIGFTSSISSKNLVGLGKKNSIPVMEDLGSGTFIDFSKYGFGKESTIQELLSNGVDIVTFSGDKLLGGPQAGIILGKKKYISKMKNNSLARVIRIDKMNLVALNEILKIYLNEGEAVEEIPTLRMLLRDICFVEQKALDLKNKLLSVSGEANHKVRLRIIDAISRAGGGSMPLTNFDSKCLEIRVGGLSANIIGENMMRQPIPVIGKIKKGSYLLDLRTIFSDEIHIVSENFRSLLNNFASELRK